ncbi:DUF11 domain-containing protein [Lutibacter sp. A80]|nr:DUF11 domain-containing protein [Lutibacter sp. A80]
MEKNYVVKKKSGLNFKKTLLTFVLFLSTIVATNSLYAQICTVNAGLDLTICESETLTLQGVVSSGNTASSNWEQVDGPPVVIVDPSSPVTNVLGITGGNVYSFRLTSICSDSSTTFQEVTFTVNSNTIADAGSAIEGCPGSYQLSANPADTGAGEIGTWTVESGPPVEISISDLNNPNATLTLPDTSVGVSVLRWTISSDSCSSSDTVEVTNYGGEIPVDAGADQDISECYSVTQSTNLDASIGGNGTGGQIGVWSFVSGPSTPTIGDINNNESSLSNLVEGEYIMRWTVSGPCASGTDTVKITVPAATQDVTDAVGINTNQVFCSSVSSAVLEANTPLYAGETAEWQVVGSPSGVNIVSSTSATTLVTFPATSIGDSYTFTYTITGPDLGPPLSLGTDEICSSTETFTISHIAPASSIELNGGVINEILAPEATSGSIPIIFSGGNDFDYELISAPAGIGIGDLNLSVSGTGPYNFNFSGLTEIGTYTIRVLRDTDGDIRTNCGSVSDEINIIVSRDYSEGNIYRVGTNAGTDVALSCGDTDAILSGNQPEPNTGYWSQVSGPNTANFVGGIKNVYNPTVNGLINGVYIFRWHIEAGDGGVDSVDDMQLTVSIAPPPFTFVPFSNNACAGVYQLPGNPLGTGETGVWTQTSGPTAGVSFVDATEPDTYVIGLEPSVDATHVDGPYQFTWTVVGTNPACGTASSSVEIITSNFTASLPDAGDDQCYDASVTSYDLIAAPLEAGSTGEWTQISGPTVSELPSASETVTISSELSPGVYEFLWTVSNTACDDKSDSVTITIADLPATFYAGDDQVVCADTSGNSVILGINADALPNGLTGTWNQLSGDSSWTYGNSTNENDINAQLDGLAPGNYEFEYVVTNGCGSSVVSEPMKFTVGLPAEIATTAAIADVCNDTTTILTGNAPVEPGNIGSWSVVSGPNTPNFDINDPTSAVTGLMSGSYTFRWTISNGGICPPSSADVSFNVVATAVAGVDQDLCNATSVLLQGNEGGGVPVEWVLTSVNAVPNGAVIASTNVTNYTIVPGDTYVFTYTIDKGGSCESSDSITVTTTAPPTIEPIAGPNQEICLGDTNSVTMAANNVAPDTGTWTLASGPTIPVEIGSTTENETFTNLIEGVYVFEWNSSTSGNCPSIKDEVVVRVYAEPSDPNIITVNGSSSCQLFTELEATAPAFGIGVWELNEATPHVPAGYTPGDIVIDSPNSPTTGLTIADPDNLQDGSYTFTWTVSNEICTAKTASVTIIFSGNPPAPANAGLDQELCKTNITPVLSTGLNADPINGSDVGLWSVESQPLGSGTVSFSDSGVINPTVSGLEEGVYEFKWTVSNPGGECSLEDFVLVTVTQAEANTNAGPDQFLEETTVVTMNATTPNSGIGTWTFIGGPSIPNILEVNNPNTIIASTEPGTYEFEWTVDNSPCATTSDTVFITIYPEVDLNLSKSIINPTSSPYFVGDMLTYQIEIRNQTSVYEATDVSVKDKLPSGFSIVPGSISDGGTYNAGANELNWSGLSISGGATKLLTYNIIIETTGSHTNYAEISGSDNIDPDSTPGNDSINEDDDASVTIGGNPLVNISLEKTINNPTPYIGEDVIFTLTVSNSGPNDATGV